VSTRETLKRESAGVRVLTVRGVVRSETSKLWSLRSPRWIVAAIVVTPLVLGTIRAVVASPVWETHHPQVGTVAALEAIAIGALPVAFLAAVLGLIAMGSEHTGDVLSGTFTVSPRRRLVVLAKCLPTLVASFTASLVGLAGAGILALVILGDRGYDEIPIAPLVGIVVTGAASAALTSILGLASAAFARSIVTAAIQLACLLALAPPAIATAAGPRGQWLTDLLPATAIQAAVTRHPAAPFMLDGAPPSTLAWWGGILVLIGWTVGSLALALVRIARRSISPTTIPRRSRRLSTASRGAIAPTGLGTVNVLRSEAFKLATLRTTWWLLGLGSIAIVTLAVLRASSFRPQDILVKPILPGDLALLTFDQQSQVIASGLGLAQALFAFMGAIAVTSEFSSGNIRPTFLAVPRRSLVLLAKVSVVTVFAGCSALVAYALAAVLATPIQHRQGFDAYLTAPIVAGTVLRCTVACILVALIGCAVGVLLRTPVASISALVGIFVLSHTLFGPMQTLTQGTPFVWLANLDAVFPYPIVAVQTVPANGWWPQWLVGNVLKLDPTQAMTVLLAWAVATFIAATLVLRRRSI
jgi:ABC-type transport system involved in multi-copper enzyme maturation permease subunit